MRLSNITDLKANAAPAPDGVPRGAARPLVISLGDPAGIGPELICRAWAARVEEKLPPFVVVSSAALLAEAAAATGITARIRNVASPDEAGRCFADALPVIDIGILPWRPGRPNADGARLALASLTAATELARSGSAAALVTGPIAKAFLQEAGFRHPGQTEFVAAACGIAAPDAVMMLAGPRLRVVPMTVHVRLADVPQMLSVDLIRRRTAIAARALSRDFGLTTPRIAIAGLNPHAGESGRLGDEEIRIIAPAIQAMRAEGLRVTGPHPADGMFHDRAREDYDLAVCMYHDQALIPLKALDFDTGVNVTLGLPIIRTSPDHGTGFAIAGAGTAHPGPTIAAIRMAGECVAQRAAAGQARQGVWDRDG